MQPARDYRSIGACPCGASRFEVHGAVLTRFICHCTICQSVYRAPFADVSAFWARCVKVSTPALIGYKRYRLPPAVQRGTCHQCDAPVVGFMSLVPLLRLVFVPSRNLVAREELPNPSLHIVYHSRLADVKDTLPKYSGYWRRELAVTARIPRGALR